MILCMRFACSITKATDTLITYPRYPNAPQFIACLVLRKYLNINAVALITERYTHRRLSVDTFPYSSYAQHNFIRVNSPQGPSLNRAARFLVIGKR
jgi:hypothetical protein